MVGGTRQLFQVGLQSNQEFIKLTSGKVYQSTFAKEWEIDSVQCSGRSSFGAIFLYKPGAGIEPASSALLSPDPDIPGRRVFP